MSFVALPVKRLGHAGCQVGDVARRRRLDTAETDTVVFMGASCIGGDDISKRCASTTTQSVICAFPLDILTELMA
jgi:hypothetical protein